jgi:cystathionine beta-lyase/cystathionine gamma-synthase
MEFATKTIHAAQPSEPETGSLIAPIFQTSTYEQDEPGVNRGFDYSRTNNPTRARLEAVLAELEGVKYCATFGSGLAAENAILQAYLKPGDEIVIPLDVYGGTYRILNKVFQPNGCVIRQIDLSTPGALEAALTPRTKLVWIESPTNPRLLVYDIAAIAAALSACRCIRSSSVFSPRSVSQQSKADGTAPVAFCRNFTGSNTDASFASTAP